MAGSPPQQPSWPAAKSQQDLAILLAFPICVVRGLFQQRIRAKHVKSNMHVTIMGKDPNFQVMRAVDILTDLQHQRHRVGRPQIGRDDFGNLVADRLGNGA
jgi:hypothetical protein